jgi:cytochrome P450
LFSAVPFTLPLTVHSVQAVLNETLRVFTPVHGNIRESKPTGILLPPSDPTYPRGPMYLPPSSTFIFITFLTHRNPALWGEDAHVYDPERWLEPERSRGVTTNPAIFTPFGAGPRTVSCVFSRFDLQC